MELGLVDPAQDVQYYWLAADGARLSGSGRELCAALRSGALRSATLVWRSGWAEWLPAHRIPELAAAIAEASVAPSSFGTLGPARRSPTPARPSSGPPPPPQRARAAMPTLSDEQGVVSATATLRPPGAVPPPARGVPVPALDSSPRAGMTPIPSFGLPSRLDTPLPAVVNKALLADPPPSSLERPLDSTLEVAPHVPAEAHRTKVPTPLAPRPELKSSVDSEAAEPRPRQESLLKIGRIGLDSRSVVMALSGLSGALLVALLALTWSRSANKNPTPEVPPQASSAPALNAPKALPGCRLALSAAKIAPSVERSVPPYAAKLEKTGELALGIAESKTRGIGLRVDPLTLDVSPVFEEEGKDAVRGVVPLTRSGSLTFFVDRDDHALRSAHTVDEVPPFTLGVSDAGFSRVVAGSTSLIWQLDPSTKITEPRSAQLADYGYGVSFRRGGQTGAVMLGFVANDGAKKSELAEVPGAPKLLGTPVIAGSNAGALIAFAGRDNPGDPWKLFVSLTTPGAAPGPARELIVGTGAGAISPALAALSGDRWLVQWTEGSSAQYHVHVQSFTADLSPIGPSIAVSPKGANAGQGALTPFADGAATLFIQTTAGHDELWGATLACAGP
ncbi:MAG TPA: GYF domain-containing protein [Polyangiaceae bacterium]